MINRSIIFIFSFFFLFTGCIEQNITLDVNKESGTLEYHMIQSEQYLPYLRYQNESQEYIYHQSPLYNRDKLAELLAREKMDLISYDLNEDTNRKDYRIAIRFRKIEKLTTLLSPFFFENFIYTENRQVFIRCRISVKAFGDPVKIRASINALPPDERKLIMDFCTQTRFKVTVTAPNQLLAQNPGRLTFNAFPGNEFPVGVFNNDIILKVSKKEDRDILNNYYRRDRNSNLFVIRSKPDKRNLELLQNAINSSGLKNRADFQISLAELIESDVPAEFTVSYRISQ